VPEVLSIRELRGQLAVVVDGVRSGAPVFAGSHRKPEVVVMSVSQYEELTGQAQDVERAVGSLAASMEMEGMALNAAELGEVRSWRRGASTSPSTGAGWVSEPERRCGATNSRIRDQPGRLASYDGRRGPSRGQTQSPDRPRADVRSPRARIAASLTSPSRSPSATFAAASQDSVTGLRPRTRVRRRRGRPPS